MKTVCKSLLFFSFLFLSSCIRSALDPVGESRGSLTAEINGKTWKSQQVDAITLFGTLLMTADRNDGSSFSFSFLGGSPEEGTYLLPSDTQAILGGITYTDDDEKSFFPESGELKITRFRDNKVVEGTFEFEGTDFNGNKVSVKNGKFDVTIAL